MSPSTPSAITIPGVIKPDGTLELAYPHGLPAGPVRVSLEQIGKEKQMATISGLPRADMPLPDAPILDAAIPAPCDLPLTGPSRPVTPVPGKMPLPDPIDESDFIE